MGISGLVFDEAVSRLAGQMNGLGEDSRLEPIIDLITGRQRGLLVDSLLERVAVFSKEPRELSPGDVSEISRLMRRANARRALLYVPVTTLVHNSVRLLAALSKIEIVRVNAPETDA